MSFPFDVATAALLCLVLASYTAFLFYVTWQLAAIRWQLAAIRREVARLIEEKHGYS